MAEPRCTLGIDLGGTNARAALVDPEGRILSSARSALSDRTPAAVVEAIAQAVEASLQGVAPARVGACGVGAAGQLRVETGEVVVAPNLGWREVPLGALLRERLRRPVRVVNDLSAAAWGELKAGSARGERHVLVVFVGSGVGSAIIANAQLVEGASGVAAELGHVKVLPGGRLCGCGERGCLEAYVGGMNLVSQMREAVGASSGKKLLELAGGKEELLTPVVLERAALAQDPAAVEIYERAVGFLALAVANQVTMLNPARLILGGGVLNNCPGIHRRVVEGVRQLSSWVSRQAVQVSPAALGDDAGLIGAALLAAQDQPPKGVAPESAAG